ncbi:MAG: type II secretion system protein [Syntrophales bacterium]
MKRKNCIRQSGFTLIEIIITVFFVAIFSAMMITFLSSSLVKSSDPIKWLRSSSNLNRVMANITADYNQFPKWKSLTNYSVGDKVLPISMNGRYYTCITAGTSGTSEPIWRDDNKVGDGTVVWNVKPWRWITTRAGMWKSGVQYSVGDIVMPTDTYIAVDGKKGPNGHFYRCKVGGTSGSTEPAWPKTGGSSIPEGTSTPRLQWIRLLQYLKETVGTPDLNNKKNNYGQGSNPPYEYYVVENKFIKFVSTVETDIVSGDPENILRVTIKNDDGDTLTALFMAKEN